MTETPAQAAKAKVRIGAWMMIAGTLGALMALLTFYDVWNASDSADRPVGWILVAVACGVLSIAGFVVLWGGLTAGARDAAGHAPPPGA